MVKIKHGTNSRDIMPKSFVIIMRIVFIYSNLLISNLLDISHTHRQVDNEPCPSFQVIHEDPVKGCNDGTCDELTEEKYYFEGEIVVKERRSKDKINKSFEMGGGSDRGDRGQKRDHKKKKVEVTIYEDVEGAEAGVGSGDTTGRSGSDPVVFSSSDTEYL